MGVTNAQVSAHFELSPDQLRLFQQSLRRHIKDHLDIDKPPRDQREGMRQVQKAMAREWPDKVNLASRVSTTMLENFASQLVYNQRPRSKAQKSTKKRRTTVPAPPAEPPTRSEMVEVEDDGTLAHTRRVSSRPKASRKLEQDANRAPRPSSKVSSHKTEGSLGPTKPLVVKTERNREATVSHAQTLKVSREQGEQVVKQFLLGVSPNLPLWLFDKFLEFGLNTQSALQDLASKDEDAIGKVLDAMNKHEKDERKSLPPYQRVLLLDAFRKLPIDLS